MVATGLGVIAYLTGHIEFADYLNIATCRVPVSCCFRGATQALVWIPLFNTYPAMIFMGDVGALASAQRSAWWP